jgi:hypothetical protein
MRILRADTEARHTKLERVIVSTSHFFLPLHFSVYLQMFLIVSLLAMSGGLTFSLLPQAPKEELKAFFNMPHHLTIPILSPFASVVRISVLSYAWVNYLPIGRARDGGSAQRACPPGVRAFLCGSHFHHRPGDMAESALGFDIYDVVECYPLALPFLSDHEEVLQNPIQLMCLQCLLSESPRREGAKLFGYQARKLVAVISLEHAGLQWVYRYNPAYGTTRGARFGRIEVTICALSRRLQLSKMLMLTGRYRGVVEFERRERPEMETLQMERAYPST